MYLAVQYDFKQTATDSHQIFISTWKCIVISAR